MFDCCCFGFRSFFALSLSRSFSVRSLIAGNSTCFFSRILGWISSILNGIAHTTNSSCNTNCAQYILFHLLISLTVTFFIVVRFVRNQLFFVWNSIPFFYLYLFLPKIKSSGRICITKNGVACFWVRWGSITGELCGVGATHLNKMKKKIRKRKRERNSSISKLNSDYTG